jgi:Na+/proline symporter
VSASIWFALIGYLLLLLAVGGWAARRTNTTKDFFIAGSGAGLWAVGLATMAASFSSFVFLGGPGLLYRVGLGSLFITLPVGFTAGLLCRVVARRLRTMAGEGVMTIPEALDRRFPGGSVRAAAAVSILLGVIAYLGLQFQGIVVLARGFGVERPEWALAVGLVVMLAYSVSGGMIAGLYTDVIQGALMLVAAAVVFVRALQLSGGWISMLESIHADRGAEFLQPQGELSLPTVLGFFFVFGIGVLGQPHLLHKFFMLRDPRQIRYLPLIFGGSQIVCLAIWLGVGLGVPALVAQGVLDPLAMADDATPTFLIRCLPAALGGLLAAGVLAALMSTADSFLNIGAAAITRDLPQAFGRPLRNEFRAARIAVVAIALVALIFSRLYADLIALVGTFAFGAFAAALAPALVLGLWWKRVTTKAAFASIVSGMTIAVTLEFFMKQSWFESLPRPPLAAGVLPSSVALSASFLVLLLLSARGRRPS